eukprot:301296-Amphidinium_carterae.1
METTTTTVVLPPLTALLLIALQLTLTTLVTVSSSMRMSPMHPKSNSQGSDNERVRTSEE